MSGNNGLPPATTIFLDLYLLPARNSFYKGFVNLMTVLLTESNIDINKCRGQGYDGASVMSGAYSGVQQRIQPIVPKTAYMLTV